MYGSSYPTQPPQQQHQQQQQQPPSSQQQYGYQQPQQPAPQYGYPPAASSLSQQQQPSSSSSYGCGGRVGGGMTTTTTTTRQQQSLTMTSHPPPPAAAVAVVEEQQQQQPPAPIYIDTQHDDMIHDVQLDYYGTKLATGSSDRTIKVYDISGNTYTHNATLTGHTGPIYQLSWSHPKYGPVLASSSFDTSVRIHREVRPAEWTLVKAFINLHVSSVNSVQFAPHEFGLHVACGSSDGRVSILSHDISNDDWIVEYIQDTPLGVNSVSWAPYSSSTTIVTTTATTMASGGSSSEKSNNTTTATTRGHQQPSSPSSSSPRIVTGGCDNGIRIYTKSTATGIWKQESFTVGGNNNNNNTTITGHTDWVRDVAWCTNVIPGVSVFASASEDKTVIIWKQQQQESSSPEEEEEEDANNEVDSENEGGEKWIPTLVNTFDDPVWRISWSITGNILAVSSGDSNITLWKEALDGTWSNVSKVEDVATTQTQTTGGKVSE